MPGLETTALSSNWKKLQQTLQSTKPTNGDTHGVKRKRPVESAQSNRHHAVRNNISDVNKIQAASSKKRRMGLTASTPVASNAASVLAQDSRPSSRASAASTQTLTNQGQHPRNKPGKYLSLDCEMVGTGPPPSLDNVLARVSIVNYHGEQIYDTYVQPEPGVEVTDYRTHVSGIRPQHLLPGTARPYTQVRAEVTALLKDKILVGHALKNDLDVLLLVHPKRDIRDTARLPAFRKLAMGKTPGLRRLAKEILGLEIQTGEHSSVEDARAAMELFRREKEAFEVYIRQRYGAARTARVPKGRNGVVAARSSPDDEEDEVEDDDGGEDEEEDDEEGEGKKSKKSKKKRKKKKRTKRA